MINQWFIQQKLVVALRKKCSLTRNGPLSIRLWCNLQRPTTDADWNSEDMAFVSPTFVGNKPQFGKPNMA